MVLEVIASTLEDGAEAEAGGADRIEVVRELERGGLTPDTSLVERLLARVRLPLRVMVRAEEPFVPTSAHAVERMCAQARVLGSLPIDGIVFGALAADHTVDLEVLRRLAEAAAPRAITFHRAFELAPDPVAALHALAAVPQVDKVLTAAGSGSADARVGRLRGWRDRGPVRPSLLFAAGLDPAAIRAAVDAGFEVHVGRAARAGHRTEGPVTASLVAAIRETATGSH